MRDLEARDKAICEFYENGCTVLEIVRNMREFGFSIDRIGICKVVGGYVLRKNNEKRIESQIKNDSIATTDEEILFNHLNVNVNYLKDIALYLEGVKHGKGDLLPLGTIALEHLWEAIRYLRIKESEL